MNRRTFLRTTGLLGVAGASGCATPFDSLPDPNQFDGSGTPTETPTPELTPTPEAPDTRSGTALTGVYGGGTGVVSKLSSYSEWLGEKPAVAMVFVDALGPSDAKKGFVDGPLTNIWDAGHVPLVSWQPFAREQQQTSEIVEREIARGKYDKELRTWADLLAEWTRPRGDDTRGRRLYFRPAHEMNGNWFPWSAVDSTRISATPEPASGNGRGENPSAGTPEEYVAMWKRIHRTFSKTKMDGTDIQWMWSPNADEIGGIRAERYYPGDAFVDWVGLDGFNFGGSQEYKNGATSTWRTPQQLFDSILGRVRELTDKPVALAEFASSSVPDSGTGNQPQKKAGWIRSVFEYVAENDIKMACWFNVDQTGNDESDWAVFGGSQGTTRVSVSGQQQRAYEAYKQTVTAPEFLSSLPNYPPLLTDDEFAGKF